MSDGKVNNLLAYTCICIHQNILNPNLSSVIFNDVGHKPPLCSQSKCCKVFVPCWIRSLHSHTPVLAANTKYSELYVLTWTTNPSSWISSEIVDEYEALRKTGVLSFLLITFTLTTVTARFESIRLSAEPLSGSGVTIDSVSMAWT